MNFDICYEDYFITLTLIIILPRVDWASMHCKIKYYVGYLHIIHDKWGRRYWQWRRYR
jgi:hypothetical protein